MYRRNFLLGVSATTGSGKLVSSLDSETVGKLTPDVQSAQVSAMMFDSTSSLLNANMEPELSDSMVAVWAEQNATNDDADGNGDAVPYGNNPMPLVGVDGNVVGFGGMLVTNEDDFSFFNDEFMISVWEEKIGSGVILWDEGHSQYYTKDKFSNFIEWASSYGYTVESTTSLAEELSNADAVVITTPSSSFSNSELSALKSFKENGGTILLHDQADYRNFDATDNLNEIAETLGIGFRFNDNQVLDNNNNAGAPFIPTTDEYNTSFPFFEPRPGINSGPLYKIGKTYEAQVKSIDDGDTIHVEVAGGAKEEIRVLGVDTPESANNAEFESPQEWEGLADSNDDMSGEAKYPYLASWSDKATQFAENKLLGKTVTFSFDANEGIADPFGRLLAYIDFDEGNYNRMLIENGYARVFDSGLTRHDELWKQEMQARENKIGVWTKSDPNKSSVIRNRPVKELFFPHAMPVGANGRPAARRVPVYAESTASISNAPLVGIDRDANLALFGATIINDKYESAAGFPVDTGAQFENFAFLSNVIDGLADKEGDIYIDGGHGQFGSQFAISAESAVFYQRYLEGFDTKFEQINDLESTDISAAKAYIITTPKTSFSDAEIQTLKTFQENGGAVIVMANGSEKNSILLNINSVTRKLESDLEVVINDITDSESSINENPKLLTTTNFNTALNLFNPYNPGSISLEPTTPTPTPTQTQTPTNTPTPTPTNTPTSTTTSGQAGLGISSAVAAILGGALWVRNRLKD